MPAFLRGSQAVGASMPPFLIPNLAKNNLSRAPRTRCPIETLGTYVHRSVPIILIYSNQNKATQKVQLLTSLYPAGVPSNLMRWSSKPSVN